MVFAGLGIVICDLRDTQQDCSAPRCQKVRCRRAFPDLAWDRTALVGQAVLGRHLGAFLHCHADVVARARFSPDVRDFAGVRRGEGSGWDAGVRTQAWPQRCPCRPGCAGLPPRRYGRPGTPPPDERRCAGIRPGVQGHQRGFSVIARRLGRLPAVVGTLNLTRSTCSPAPQRCKCGPAAGRSRGESRASRRARV